MTDIARAAASDAAEIAEIFLASRRDALPYLPLVHTDEETRVWIANVMLKECDVWLARAGAEIAGFLALKPGWIDHLYLRPGFYRAGIGTALLTHAKSLQTSLRLYTFQKNTRARSFYEKHGFIPIALTDGADNEEREPDVLYEWRCT